MWTKSEINYTFDWLLLELYLPIKSLLVGPPQYRYSKLFSTIGWVLFVYVHANTKQSDYQFVMLHNTKNKVDMSWLSIGSFLKFFQQYILFDMVHFFQRADSLQYKRQIVKLTQFAFWFIDFSIEDLIKCHINTLNVWIYASLSHTKALLNNIYHPTGYFSQNLPSQVGYPHINSQAFLYLGFASFVGRHKPSIQSICKIRESVT